MFPDQSTTKLQGSIAALGHFSRILALGKKHWASTLAVLLRPSFKGKLVIFTSSSLVDAINSILICFSSLVLSFT